MTEPTAASLAQALSASNDLAPLLIVIAGPNGAGKSTFFHAYLEPLDIEFVNADLIARALLPDEPGAVAYQAARLAAERRSALLGAGASFCMETVFSDPARDKVGFIASARRVGYRIVLVYIGVDDPELLVARVAQRVFEGGHDVPDDKIRSRYPRTLTNLAAAVPLANWALLLDNSLVDEPYRLVALYRDGVPVERSTAAPRWAAVVED